jgi:hypothetical protein
VYVCIEAVEQSACPSTGAHVIREDRGHGFLVSISQERRPGVEMDEETARAWADATVDVN